MSYYWPILLGIASNIFYHICAKSTPEKISPFASLTITYLVSGVVSLGLFFVFSPGSSLAQEYKRLDWSAFLFGIALVGLELANVYMYKVGWNMNTGFLVQSIFLAIALILLGFLLYHEPITWTKALGAAICLVGIFIIKH